MMEDIRERLRKERLLEMLMIAVGKRIDGEEDRALFRAFYERQVEDAGSYVNTTGLDPFEIVDHDISSCASFPRDQVILDEGSDFRGRLRDGAYVSLEAEKDGRALVRYI